MYENKDYFKLYGQILVWTFMHLNCRLSPIILAKNISKIFVTNTAFEKINIWKIRRKYLICANFQIELPAINENYEKM